MKRIVSVGDLHCGSMYALHPPNFVSDDDQAAHPQNPAGTYLFNCWDNFTWRAAQFDPDIIEIGGDLVEGPQRKQNGYEITLASPNDQKLAAVQCLDLLKQRCPRAKLYFIAGTPYHVGDWGSIEEGIAKSLGGEKYQSIGPGNYCRQVLWIRHEGVIVEFAHHIGGASGFYRMTGLDREAQWSAMAGKDATKGIPKADLLVRHHVHFFGHIEHESKEVLITPCWKLQDNHARKGGVHRFHPAIGGAFIEMDGERKKRGESPFLIRKQLYSLPPAPVTEL